MKEGDEMSKKVKQYAKLRHKTTLSSDEMLRLLELDGWFEDPDNPQKGSHKHLVHSVKKGKVTVPTERKVLIKDTKDDIFNQAGLMGE